MELLELAMDLAILGDSEHQSYTPIVFACSSAFYGILMVLLDFCTCKATQKPSFLKLSYSGLASISMIFLWGVGAGLAGLLGTGVGIFEISRTACIFVGAGWPVVLPRLIASANSELSTEKVPME
ncbi:hypothetical protein HG263_12160 [Pseudoalteromonas sp. JBTF-M23]|uniref:Uncharacterized protein n=1 Tax=Pseudoalteromonas caenipelagi TaxID=2726988 RepID=A0A849VHS6_9GAMM|nr:hypothetical protein [Pseudoalteromonas caenipelagi]NOU51281.1 hypothetical protein [Pseudoalteromonas caenipelagi]